jgi:vacuolar protein-sorting-associated protein 4
MYGPPGTGKSYLAKAVATEAGRSCFMSCSSSDLVSKYQGESERLVKMLFQMARKKAPTIIFIDEVDSLCGSRSEGENESARRIKTEFLTQMDGVGKSNKGVLVLGATNTPWEIDSAIRRRFEKRVYIPLPDATSRQTMYKIHIGKTPHGLKEKDFKKLGQVSEGYSGADLNIVVREALYAPLRKCQEGTHFKKVPDPEGKEEFKWTPCSPGDPQAVEMTLYDVPGHLLLPPVAEFKDFEFAQKKTKPSVGQGDLKKYEEWTAQYGMDG